MRIQGSACLGVTQHLVLSALSVLVRLLCSALMCCCEHWLAPAFVFYTGGLFYTAPPLRSTRLERATDLTDHLFRLKDREADTEIFSECIVLFFNM